MEYLWSPWRMKYIQNTNEEGSAGCIFCQLPKLQDGPENLIVHREKFVYVILNRFPYTSGHLMVIPFDHHPTFETLDAPVLMELMKVANTSMQVLRQVYQPQAFNMGANIGMASGAGVADHVHMHIVPRWNGDTNFMSTLGQTRVLPEALEETYQRIKAAWKV